MIVNQRYKIVGTLTAILLGLAIVFVVGRLPASAPSGIAFKWQVDDGADKFQGKVTQVRVPTSENGVHRMEIDGHIYVLIDYGDSYTGISKGMERGKMTGSWSLGTKVEVYAAKIREDEYSIYGSEQYYVKSLD